MLRSTSDSDPNNLYRFSIKKQAYGTKWEIKRDWQPDNAWMWETAKEDCAHYSIKVEVKDANSDAKSVQSEFVVIYKII